MSNDCAQNGTALNPRARESTEATRARLSLRRHAPIGGSSRNLAAEGLRHLQRPRSQSGFIVE